MPDPLQTATEVAHEAGALLSRRFGGELRVEHKGAIDLVTEADQAAEALIVERLRSAFPEHAILAEEGTGGPGRSHARWLVDPLDGTTNFAHGYPFFAVSIALEVEGRVTLGVVHDPIRGETFRAERGRGATLDGKPLRVSSVIDLDHALLVTGFPYSIREAPERTLALLDAFLMVSQGIRRDGSAALDLCYLSAGRLDGFWELGLKPWDVAAGSVILEEAGGRVTNLDGSPLDLAGGALLASNGPLHGRMLEVASAALELR